ncbi:isopentenyldiphosphate isomerase [Bacillus mesophilus]|uniref:NUDIX domain-containing protein n=1 Tax=Bacillus mesophilus TaxID=1808955 RepID=A0A6M0Q4W3_9BACI|nr:NUDIX domain-containing protein [Bacillus mesophilus]MBM7661045.1 isopentenyldiphosphate isomerase [Bacillus mesophilus]NEY71417.1 NUDIX domain-containing protein [Bacillus mesophilus]
MGNQEKLKIFDDNKNQIGVASRGDVHKHGYWHEAFHCWFIGKERGKDYIYLQLRSKGKQDYPNLLDITSAGHLLSDETVRDGVREIKEEIGIDVAFEELVMLGVLDYCVTKENFIDKEMAHVFLYRSNLSFNDFTLQAEEVSGIVRANFDDFADLWFGVKEEIEIGGFEINHDGKKVELEETVSKDRFVPHQISFYQEVVQRIREQIK